MHSRGRGCDLRAAGRNGNLARGRPARQANCVDPILEAFLDEAPVGLGLVDSGFRYLRANRALGGLTGLAAGSHEGRTVREVSPWLADQLEPALVQAGADGVPVQLEVHSRDGAAASRVWLVGIQPLRPDGSRLDGFAIGAVDITPPLAGRERAAAEAAQEAREIRERLLKTQRMEVVGRLAGGIAHDFNNLLTVILSHGHLLREALADREDARADADEVIAAADRAARLTSQLLTFARQRAPEPREVDLNSLLLGLSRMLERLLGADVELAFDLASGLWPLRADPAQLEQVVVNLLINARDAMPRGGSVTVRTANCPPDEGDETAWVMLSVQDTGLGMSHEVRQRIFEPFFTTKPAGRGTGLGLATCFGIIRQHGGSIEVESEEGEGTTFTILLPTAGTAAMAGAQEAPPPPPRGRGELVLVVEDEPAIRRIVLRTLQDAGYETLDAADAVEAAGLLEDSGRMPDLLLTDVVLPRGSGPEFARNLRDRQPRLPVLFVSGYAPEQVAERALPGAEGQMLPKPFLPLQLLAAVRTALDVA